MLADRVSKKEITLNALAHTKAYDVNRCLITFTLKSNCHTLALVTHINYWAKSNYDTIRFPFLSPCTVIRSQAQL